MGIEPVKRRDPLTPKERSARMALVLGRENRSTEMRVAAYMIRNGISGWKRHVAIQGRPDFCFERERVAVFVDGCFWHGCPKCRRNVPHSRRDFWRSKIESNQKRDRKVNRGLRGQGYFVLRIWEHALRGTGWIARLQRALEQRRQGTGYNLSQGNRNGIANLAHAATPRTVKRPFVGKGL